LVLKRAFQRVPGGLTSSKKGRTVSLLPPFPDLFPEKDVAFFDFQLKQL